MGSVELISKTELTSIAGTESVYVQEAGSPFTVKRLLLNTIKSWIESFTTPVGTIIMYAKATAPTNYLICDGTAVSRTTYADLYAVIGTVYGVGDNSTTFNLPDYRALSPKGVGNQTINTRVKTGPAALGSIVEDTVQGHKHVLNDGSGTDGLVSIFGLAAGGAGDIATGMGAMKDDGTNGTPRTAAQTQDCTIGTNFCIKYH